MEMSFTEAQDDMRQGYCSGGPGILASAIAWACAAGIAASVSTHAAVWALLIGGLFIFPASILFCKLLGARGTHVKGNPLGVLAGASTFWLIFAIVIALVLSWHQQTWFFPAMLLTLGGRYLVFATAYGMRHYWVLGLLLATAGVITFVMSVQPAASAAVGSAIEGSFSVVCISHYFRRMRPDKSLQRTALMGRR
ncbi:hypothetical protein [Rhodanobacter sp. C05]|uniref:DUF7010 family protein n=1 Tax=Rhodanobacter sp. C05 TaxID=1945855 RepID=UPI0009860BCB|nr:hypothetical protein [Rhodanobacter sp. C05]OOG42578.1 hypothetical protein B0E51_03690 [Rhodanobacter sp. C05]